jgi:hypothetical protein
VPIFQKNFNDSFVSHSFVVLSSLLNHKLASGDPELLECNATAKSISKSDFPSPLDRPGSTIAQSPDEI